MKTNKLSLYTCQVSLVVIVHSPDGIPAGVVEEGLPTVQADWGPPHNDRMESSLAGSSIILFSWDRESFLPHTPLSIWLQLSSRKQII
jgi:hypothetical protein